MKMETSLTDSHAEGEWQSSFPVILLNLKDKLHIASRATVQTNQLPKTLTNEARYMISVLLCFVVLSVAGSLITAFEFFCEGKAKKNEANGVNFTKKIKEEENRTKRFENSAEVDILKKIKRFFKCFCLVTNGRKIVTHSISEGKEINCIYGIRAINLFWAILIHTCMLYFAAIKNVEDQGPFLRTGFVKVVSNADYLNDAFFTLGGFLNAYSFFQDYKKKSGNISWLHFYVKRIVRIMPLYMIVLGFFTTIFPYFGSSPLWPTYTTNPLCKKFWWWNILFINNFQTAHSQCMIWSWYLAADFQFYCVIPLFIIPLIRWPKFGYIVTSICICGSCLLNFLITRKGDLSIDISRFGFHLSDYPGFIDRSFKYFNELFEKPYSRVCSYLVGILLGHYLSNRKGSTNIKTNSVFLYCGWVVTALFMWICFFSIDYAYESLIKFALYNGMKHLLYAAGISWLIFVCFTGKAEFINRILSWHGFVISSRLSFSAYLLNIIVIEYYFFQLTEELEFSLAYLVIVVAYVFFWTFIASFVLSVLVEIPVSRLYSMITSKKKKK